MALISISYSPRPDTSLHCKATNTGLVYLAACLFTRQLFAGTKLYCLVTEAHRCEKLAQSFYAIVPGRDSNPGLLVASPTLYRDTKTCIGHRFTTRPGAQTVVSYKHDQKVQFWVVFWTYSTESNAEAWLCSLVFIECVLFSDVSVIVFLVCPLTKKVGKINTSLITARTALPLYNVYLS